MKTIVKHHFKTCLTVLQSFIVQKGAKSIEPPIPAKKYLGARATMTHSARRSVERPAKSQKCVLLGTVPCNCGALTRNA